MTTTTTTADRTGAAVLSAAAALAAERAAEADRTGRLAPEVVEALAATGLPRHFVPERWGGAAATFREATDAVARIGEGCASAAWCGAMFAYTGRFAAHLPEDGQRDLWGRDPGALLVPGLVPAGEAEPADGGFTLRGRWHYVSGAGFADWALIAGPAPGGIEPRFFAVPRSAFEIEETWDAVGMRATSSHTLRVRETFVPGHRSVPFKEVMGGVNHVSALPQHTVPLPAVGGLTCITALLGAARGALSAAVATAAGKRAGGAPPDAAADLAIATAAADIDAAGLLLDRVVSVLDGGEGRARAFQNANRASYAARRLVDAVNGLMRSAGTAAQDRGGDLQRHWRDVTVGCSHAALRPERAAPGFVQSLVDGA